VGTPRAELKLWLRLLETDRVEYWFYNASTNITVAIFRFNDFEGSTDTPYMVFTQSQSNVTTDGQSAALSWCQAPTWTQKQTFVTVRQLWAC
jgi:hypothetical protein